MPCCGVPILYHFRAIAALQRGRPIVESHRAFNRALHGVWPSTRLRGVKPAKFSVKSKMIFTAGQLLFVCIRRWPRRDGQEQLRPRGMRDRIEIGRPFDRGRRAYDAMSFRPRRCGSVSCCRPFWVLVVAAVLIGGRSILGPYCEGDGAKPSMHTAGVLSCLLCRTALSAVTCLRQ